jgi:hypothetical protein
MILFTARVTQGNPCTHTRYNYLLQENVNVLYLANGTTIAHSAYRASFYFLTNRVRIRVSH